MSEQLIVETKAGKVRGARQTNFEGDEFYAFRGVPYAKPPVGQLRFQVNLLLFCALFCSERRVYSQYLASEMLFHSLVINEYS